MKRLLNILAFVAVLSASLSCEPENLNPTAEFKDKFLVIPSGQSVEVVVNLDKPAAAAVSVPVEVSSTSDAYQVSGQTFDFAEGESSATLIVTDAGLPESGSVTLKLLAAEGIQVGTNYTCVITKVPTEILVYNFARSNISLVSGGTANIKLTLEGQYSGKNFRAAEDIVIPVVISGEGQSNVQFEEGVVGFTVNQGSNTATLKLIGGEFEAASSASLSLGNVEGVSLTAGETEVVNIELCTYLDPAELVGTWNFSHIYEVEELSMWFEEMEDDVTLLPLNNEGFTLTFAEGADGSITLTPNNTGDFAKFFRTATITHTTPVNLVATCVATGAYTALESNQYRDLEAGAQFFTNTFFKLSNANRAFDTTESLGESVISLRLTENGDLELTIRDYDTPPFGEMWWDDENFDPEMFGFCSVFTKAE